MRKQWSWETYEVELRDWPRTGYLVPGLDGLGLWPESCWDVVAAAAVAAVSWKLGSETVLVFGPESVSYERSRLIRRCILREISARVFFVKITKIMKSHISNISKILGIMETSISSISRIAANRKNQFSNISRIGENRKTQLPNISRILECCRPQFPIFPGVQ